MKYCGLGHKMCNDFLIPGKFFALRMSLAHLGEGEPQGLEPLPLIFSFAFSLLGAQNC